MPLQEGPGGTACYYDFVKQLEIFPERELAWYGQLQFSWVRTTLCSPSAGQQEQEHETHPPPPGEVSTRRHRVLVLRAAGNPGQTRHDRFYRVADVASAPDGPDRGPARGDRRRGLLAAGTTTSLTRRSTSRPPISAAGSRAGPLLAALNSGLVNPFVLPGNRRRRRSRLWTLRRSRFWKRRVHARLRAGPPQRRTGALSGAPGNWRGLSHGREQFRKGQASRAVSAASVSATTPASCRTTPNATSRSVSRAGGTAVSRFRGDRRARQDRYSDFARPIPPSFGTLAAEQQPAFRGSLGSGSRRRRCRRPAPRGSCSVSPVRRTSAPRFRPAQVAAALARSAGRQCAVNVYAEATPNCSRKNRAVECRPALDRAGVQRRCRVWQVS